MIFGLRRENQLGSSAYHSLFLKKLRFPGFSGNLNTRLGVQGAKMDEQIDNNFQVGLADLMMHPFYICLTKDFREILINMALTQYPTFKMLAKEIGCTPSTLRYFRDHANRYISSLFLANLLNLVNVSIPDAEKCVVSIKRGCNNMPLVLTLPIKITPALALLIAKVCGDGSILSDWRFHYTNNQLNLVHEVIDAVSTSIGQTKHYLHDRIDRRVYEIKFPSVVGYILYLMGAPKSYKVHQDFKIPEWIMSGNKIIKSYFLRGIFDDESTVVNSGNHVKKIVLAMGKTQVHIASLNLFLSQIQYLLSSFAIDSGALCLQQKYDDRIMLRFGIYKKSSFKHFQKYIGFSHLMKKEKLQNILTSYVDTPNLNILPV